MSPLPATFFQNLPRVPRHTDARQPYLRQCLQAALRLPATHRWVADWIFVDPYISFHPNLPLKPESFDSTIALRIFHSFLDVEVPPPPHIKQSACQIERPAGNPICPVSKASGVCPVSGSRPSDSRSNPLAQPHFHAADADLLLLPVASVDGLTVGYAFGTGAAIAEVSSVPNFVGRVVFDANTEHFLLVMAPSSSLDPNHPQSATVIMSVTCAPDRSVREHAFFTVPNLQYSFECLPNHVYSMSTAQSRPDQPSEVPIADALDVLFSAEDPALRFVETILDEPESSDSPTYIDTPSPDSDSRDIRSPPSRPSQEPDVARALLEAWMAPDPPVPLTPTQGTTSHRPWLSDLYGQTPDGVGMPRRAGRSPTSAGAFSMQPLEEALQNIETSLSGSFYSSRARHEPFDYSTGRPLEAGFRNVIARLEPVNAHALSKLRKQAAALYFSSTTRVRSDEALLTIPGTLALPMHQRPESNASDHAVAVRPVPVIATAAVVVSPGDVEAEKKAARLEAKKRRNRLSAARSNLKRKEVWDAKKRVLRELRDRVTALESRKRVLMGENEALRRQVHAR